MLITIGLTPFYVGLETRFPVALCRLGTMRAKVSEELEHDARWFEIGPISDRTQGRGEQGGQPIPVSIQPYLLTADNDFS